MDPNVNNVTNVFDINGLDLIRQKSNATDNQSKEQALEQAAKQFEAIFMQMLLKSMRSAQEVLEADSPFNSQSTKFYRDMHDQQMAVEMSSNGSLGLSELIVRQLGADSDNFTPQSVFKADAINDRAQLKTDMVLPHRRQFTDSVIKPQFQQTNSVKEQMTYASPGDFVKAMSEPAKFVEKKLSVPFQVVIAQAALETGWGQKVIRKNNGDSSNNLFNIKADKRWQGDRVVKETLEFEQGTVVKKREPFRVYDSISDSVTDYVNFLSNSDRYQQALKRAENVEHFLHNLQKAGYATDPNYANKIMGTLGTVKKLLSQ